MNKEHDASPAHETPVEVKPPNRPAEPEVHQGPHFTGTTPPTGWHYTTGSGLLGIQQSKHICASNIAYLNDHQEGRFGISSFKMACGRAVEHLGGAYQNSIIEGTEQISVDPETGGEYVTGSSDVAEGFNLSATLYSLQDRGGHLSPEPTFAASFCESGDLLSQWRGYANGDGYSIGFNTDSLRQISFASARPMFGKVLYGEESHTSLTARIISSLDSTHDLNATKIAEILQETVFSKHEAFKDEREWRIALYGNHLTPDVRSMGNLLVPYVSLPLPKEGIVAIRVGPGPMRRARRQSAFILLDRLKQAGLATQDASVMLSSAPYRGA